MVTVSVAVSEPPLADSVNSTSPATVMSVRVLVLFMAPSTTFIVEL